MVFLDFSPKGRENSGVLTVQNPRDGSVDVLPNQILYGNPRTKYGDRPTSQIEPLIPDRDSPLEIRSGPTRVTVTGTGPPRTAVRPSLRQQWRNDPHDH